MGHSKQLFDARAVDQAYLYQFTCRCICYAHDGLFVYIRDKLGLADEEARFYHHSRTRRSSAEGYKHGYQSFDVGHGSCISFNRDIAPILHEHCAPCHRSGGAAPFPLIRYGDARRRAEQIVTVTRSRYMPPWLPEPAEPGFVGERRLTDRQITLLGEWVRFGMSRGEPADAATPPVWSAEWPLGEPELILELPRPFTLPEAGPDGLGLSMAAYPISLCW